MDILNTLSYVVMAFGIFFMLFGIIGLFQPKKDFYYRILIACKIDTVGVLTMVIGLSIRHGVSFFTGKLILILVLFLVLNPLVAHVLARSAYASGYLIDSNHENLQNLQNSQKRDDIIH
jgi:multicomponent Na+:H+ antiporter subunit G